MYKRQLLEEDVNIDGRLLRVTGSLGVALEVETQNENAIRLYRSCGFVEVTTYGYYNVDLEK